MQERLAGLNPMAMRRVALGGTHIHFILVSLQKQCNNTSLPFSIRALSLAAYLQNSADFDPLYS